MRLVVFGLGNPGRKLRSTLHNAGFEATDKLAALLGGRTRKRCLRCYRSFAVGDVEIVQPLTWMNSSGEAARLFAPFSPERPPIVILDNLDLPMGEVRIRPVRKTSTHRGLLSIQEVLGAGVRPIGIFIGIGRPEEGTDVVDYVLARPATEEARARFDEATTRAAEAAKALIDGEDLPLVQQRFNSRSGGSDGR